MGRGQAAMEFITTYGWAILVLLSMIAALSYFGVMNANKYTPERCQLTAGVNCKEHLVTYSANVVTVKMTLENKLGKSIDASTIVANATVNGVVSKPCVPTPNSGPILADGTVALQCDYTAGAVNTKKGQPIKLQINMIYTPVDSSYAKTASGEISTTLS